MPRRHAISSAIATCSAARLAASGGTAPALAAGESISVSAVALLGAHAAADAQATLDSSRRSPRLLGRARRRLRHAHALSVQLLALDDPAAIDAAVCFVAGVRLAAHRFGRLARRPRRRLERSAVRALRRAASMQNEVASTVASVSASSSVAGLGGALRELLEAQRQLVVILDDTIACDAVCARRRRTLRSVAARAERVHDQLASALVCIPVTTPAAAAPAGRSSRAPIADRRRAEPR